MKTTISLNSLPVVLLGTVFTATPATQGAPAPNAATRAFLQAHPVSTTMVENDRVVAIHGATLASDDDPNTTTDQFVASFLAQNGPALGVDPLDLVLKEKTPIRFGQTMVYTYTQRIEGLPVYASVVTIPVALGAVERIAYVGIRLVPPPGTPLPADLLTQQDAIAQLAGNAAYSNLTFAAGDKVIYEANDGSLHRAWTVRASGQNEGYLFVVDANTGAILAEKNQIIHAPISGRVTGHPTPCCGPYKPGNQDSCPDDPLGMPGIEVSVSVPGVAPVYADSDGYYVFNDGITEGVGATVTTRLVGRWVTVENWGALNADLQPVPAARAIVTPAQNVDFVFNPTASMCSIWPQEFDTAQVSVFEGVERTHDWFRLRGGAARIDRNLPARANDYSWGCNAVYNETDGDEYISFGPSDDRCNNSAFSTVVSHEYGHFILDQKLGFYDENVNGIVHEGFADTVGTYFWDTPWAVSDILKNWCYARRVDEPDVRFNVCSPPLPWCNGCGDVHWKGLALAGAFWDLRAEIGDPVYAEGLLAAFVELTDGRWSDKVVLDLVAADDDDGNLLNGTPHIAEIYHSFVTLHGWNWPLCQTGLLVRVAWQGPPPGIEPTSEDGDFTVDTATCPPGVTLKTTTKGGVAVSRWYVGRQSGKPRCGISRMGRTAEPEHSRGGRDPTVGALPHPQANRDRGGGPKWKHVVFGAIELEREPERRSSCLCRDDRGVRGTGWTHRRDDCWRGEVTQRQSYR